MLIRKIKNISYIILFIIILSFILPIYSHAIDTDSIYVWSNNSSSISTSVTSSNEDKDENMSTSENSSR